MSDNIHEPTPEFSRFLEWQVATALRRRERFAEPAWADARTPARVAATGTRRHFATAAIAMLSLLAGAGVVTAAARIQGSQAKQVLVEQQQGEIRVAQLELAVAKKEADEAQRRVSLGLAGPSEAQAVQQRLQSLQTRLQQTMLNLEEVEKSGQPVQDDITSPLVGGRDFVADRLRLQVQLASLAAGAESAALSNAKRRFDVGLMTAQELADVQAATGRAANELRLVQQQLDLREQFVQGKLSAKDAVRQRALAVTRSEIQTAVLALQAAQERYAFVQRQFKVGLATEMETLKAQVAVLEKEKDLKALRANLQVLESGGD